LVDGCDFAGAFFAAGFVAVELDFAGVVDDFLAPAALVDEAAGAAAPDATRDECFVRCRVAFFGVAASATDDSAKAAISATTNILIVLRTIRIDLRPQQLYRISVKIARLLAIHHLRSRLPSDLTQI
jgi:hypothetical protein